MSNPKKSPSPSPDPDIDDGSSKRQATRFESTWRTGGSPCNHLSLCLSLFLDRVFKKSSSNGKITVYLGKRDFVDHITHVDPIGMC